MKLVLGANGFLGKAVVRKLEEAGENFVTSSLSYGEDLRDFDVALELFKKHKPEIIINCASFVGGIQWGLKRNAELFDNNMRIIANIFKAANQAGVKRIINPISNCVYPAEATLFKEDEIWDGKLHETVDVYGHIRKISYIGSLAYARQYGLETVNIVMSNMYGPYDHFEEERSHALGALIMKFYNAKQNNDEKVIMWGTGSPVREWLHVDDGAKAMLLGCDIDAYDGLINVGIADGISIYDMAVKIKDIIGFDGEIELDTTKPDGAKYKTVDGSLGEKLLKFKPEIDFDYGLKNTIEWYKRFVENK